MVRILYFKDQCLNRPINMRIVFFHIFPVSSLIIVYLLTFTLYIFFKNNSILQKKEVGFLNELLRFNY